MKNIKINRWLMFFFLGLMFYSNAQTCIPDTIIFISQAQVDAFPSDYPGCSEILGTVIIEDNFFGGQMTNLNGLIQMKTIAGDFQIKGSK